MNQMNGEKWMTIDELIEYLPDHPPKHSVYWRIRHKGFPCHRPLGKGSLFLQSEVDEWMKSGKVENKKRVPNE